MFVFPTEFINKELFFNSEKFWSLVEDEITNFKEISNKELRIAIIRDLLFITMWEKIFNKKCVFSVKELTRFVRKDMMMVVLYEMSHPEIKSLIHEEINNQTTEFRIKDNPVIIQAAMEYCNVYYEGYTLFDGAITLINNNDVSEIDLIRDVYSTLSYNRKKIFNS